MKKSIQFLCLCCWANYCFAQSAPVTHATDPALKQLLAESEWSKLFTNASGEITALTICGKHASDELLLRMWEIPSLEALNLQVSSSNAISALGMAALSNLTSLRIACVGNFPAPVFRAMCGLTNLQQLVLVGAFPPAGEYAGLAKLKQLHSLEISYATNFSDAELPVITNLTLLTNLSLRWTGVSASGTNSLSYITNLSCLEWKGLLKVEPSKRTRDGAIPVND